VSPKCLLRTFWNCPFLTIKNCHNGDIGCKLHNYYRILFPSNWKHKFWDLMVRWHRSKVNFHGTCSSWKGYVETAHILHFQLYIREAAVPPQASRRSRQTRSWAVDSQNPPSPRWRRPSWTAGRSCWTCCWWKIWPFLRNPTSSPPRLQHITVPAHDAKTAR